MKTPNKQIQPQNAGKQDNTSSVKKDKAREFLFRMLESKGATRPVDEGYYNIFINMPEKQMMTVIKAIIIDRRNDINKLCFDQNKTSDVANKELYDMIANILDLIARGIMSFEEDTCRLVLFKPIGGPPNAVTEKKIRQKIEKSKPLVMKALIEIFEKQNQKSP